MTKQQIEVKKKNEEELESDRVAAGTDGRTMRVRVDNRQLAIGRNDEERQTTSDEPFAAIWRQAVSPVRLTTAFA